ncbi:hypothetical protein PF005_g27225 [Phytophthora fragariae]|uniref:Uncharacterized protein n=1 Tax=Phytophthora fragariae TaxID=53985 RepID=A0A6A3Q6J9_9STRA|nr:hypothetical protein PF003_g28174 [Phytophthora fragariae]KAE8921853.1 hypothetical protein PF009_g27873 [Phytophthora fragariae]KAE9069754.1 hypothetical protein PF007_g27196 [Phytophthora fragariae]KAE9083118.1 hypothetical protein PF006_g26755 [Phytophthora fragariae]KAE9171237.1 hypothetical protein PF005_g27225 [Phytophthora fragariae]
MGRVKNPNAGEYCTVEAVWVVEAAAASCRSAAGIGASGVEVPDTTSERDVPATLDVVLALPDPDVTADEPLEFAERVSDVVGTLVELPMPADATSGPLPPLCAVVEVVVV